MLFAQLGMSAAEMATKKQSFRPLSVNDGPHQPISLSLSRMHTHMRTQARAHARRTRQYLFY